MKSAMYGKTFGRGMLLSACVLLAGIGTAQAGFQWTAPIGGGFMSSSAIAGPRPAELPPRTAAAPIAPVTSEALPSSMGDINAGAPIATMPDGPANAAPIYGNGMTNDPITWNQTHNASPVMQSGYAPRAPQSIMPAEAVPLTPVTASPVAAVTTTTTTAPSGYSQYEVASGFGRDLPLVMAIRQIVPAQYGFVFDQGIDTSAHVSWQGGRPWDLVLQDTLAPMSMTATINGNVVSISRSGMQMASAAPAAQVSTNTVQSTTTTTMTATPVAMTSAGPAVVMDDLSTGGNGYVNARASSSADLLANGTWTAPRNSSLRSILEDWSQRVGVELYWASEYDYPIQSAVSLQGTFEEAVQTLLKGLSDSKPRPMGRLHPNLPNGPAVLVIETRQNSM